MYQAAMKVMLIRVSTPNATDEFVVYTLFLLKDVN
jgi:hypothetical protein